MRRGLCEMGPNGPAPPPSCALIFSARAILRINRSFCWLAQARPEQDRHANNLPARYSTATRRPQTRAARRHPGVAGPTAALMPAIVSGTSAPRYFLTPGGQRDGIGAERARPIRHVAAAHHHDPQLGADRQLQRDAWAVMRGDETKSEKPRAGHPLSQLAGILRTGDGVAVIAAGSLAVISRRDSTRSIRNH
jgi:hypothetical protein